MIRSLVIRSLDALGYRLERNNQTPQPDVYNEDGLRAAGKNLSFLKDPRFVSAYNRGYYSGHPFEHLRWRVAITCWAASHGAKLTGDFVECGVNTGIHSLAICEYLRFNELDKSFYLFDTFRGIPFEQRLPSERTVPPDYVEPYTECYEATRDRFSDFRRARLVRGTIPESLSQVTINEVAYLSIDMNIAYPERKAIEYFWPKMSPGAFAVLDDYAWRGHEAQKSSMDDFARSVGVEILTLPTGQGLMAKP